MRVPAVIGHRSWIARRLIARLGPAVTLLPKEGVGDMDHSDTSCMYVFPGRARPNAEEMARERNLIEEICSIPRDRQPGRLVYISSRVGIDPSDDFGRLKVESEDALRRTFRDRLRTIVPGAVFGPSQPWRSLMLVPTIARRYAKLTDPDRVAAFIYVEDLVTYLLRFSGEEVIGTMRGYFPTVDDPQYIPGTFYMTAWQVLALSETIDGLRSAAEVSDWRGPPDDGHGDEEDQDLG